jgi:hypothetical protein
MRTVIAAAVFAACASSLDSQIVARLNRSAAGVPEVRIRNDAALSLAAWAVAMNPSGEAEDRTQFVAFFDQVIDPVPLLGPQQERTVLVMLRSRPGKQIQNLFEPPIITAGIFTDGTATGDRVVLTRLMLRRCNMLLAVETSIDTLMDAGKRNVPRDQLIQQFRKMADAVWRWYIPPEQQVGRDLYRSIIDTLRNVPEGPVGSPFPPSALITEQTAMLNRRRVALLQSQPGLTTATLNRAR